jgi:hypothetical protein
MPVVYSLLVNQPTAGVEKFSFQNLPSLFNAGSYDPRQDRPDFEAAGRQQSVGSAIRMAAKLEVGLGLKLEPRLTRRTLTSRLKIWPGRTIPSCLGETMASRCVLGVG